MPPFPQLIRAPTDATPTEAAGKRGGPRGLPDDFLREASARLGIMALVAAGLWVVGTILGRLAMRSMQGDESMGLGPTMGDAIAAVSVLASLLLLPIRGRPTDTRSESWTSVWCTWS